jgi:hypothetical protein
MTLTPTGGGLWVSHHTPWTTGHTPWAGLSPCMYTYVPLPAQAELHIQGRVHSAGGCKHTLPGCLPHPCFATRLCTRASHTPHVHQTWLASPSQRAACALTRPNLCLGPCQSLYLFNTWSLSSCAAGDCGRTLVPTVQLLQSKRLWARCAAPVHQPGTPILCFPLAPPGHPSPGPSRANTLYCPPPKPATSGWAQAAGGAVACLSPQVLYTHQGTPSACITHTTHTPRATGPIQGTACGRDTRQGTCLCTHSLMNTPTSNLVAGSVLPPVMEKVALYGSIS